MRMRRNNDFFELLKETSVALIISLFGFLKRLYVFAFFFGMPYAITGTAAMLLIFGLQTLGVPFDVICLLKRILLTIVPVIPTGVYTLCAIDDQSDEFSPDLCFVAWIATAVYVWKFI